MSFAAFRTPAMDFFFKVHSLSLCVRPHVYLELLFEFRALLFLSRASNTFITATPESDYDSE
jgi:hypothetical protein